MAENEPVFDIIFAGGGTVACIIAGRLAEADPSLKILLVEAGPNTRNNISHIQPARYLTHILPTTKAAKFMIGRESEYLNGRSPIVPCGQCVGGGSSVNFAMYTRPSISDFDDWEKKYGNVGWGSADLIPLLKKVETFQATEGLDSHGYSGPLKVSFGGLTSNIGQDFLEVGKTYDKTRKSTNDTSNFATCNEYGRWPKWIDGKTGARSDVPHHYIYNKQDNKNLQILSGCLVKRVIFEGTQAVGVEYVHDKRLYPDSSQVGVITARATRLVVVSAGAFGSPVILERSGIGSKSILKEFGIDTVVDLPGVGENYQDHPNIHPAYIASDETVTLDPIVHNDEEEITKWSKKWLEDGSGLLSANGLDAGIKLRPNDVDLNAIGEVFQPKWKEFFVPSPDKGIFWMGPIAIYLGNGVDPPPAGRKSFGLPLFLLYPSSLGSIHLTSAEDVYAQGDFDPKFLKEKDDLALLVWGYKVSREFARRMKCYRGEYKPDHPAFSPNSDAACHEDGVLGPVPVDAPNIDYTAEDDKIIEQYVRNWASTTWHSLGTCAMKAREDGGVVDSRLNVYGVQKLKVADMSIAPQNVGSNTYSSALAIGEKAALIIAEELGLRLA
ncbi:GMC oxidoreductase family protein [Abortiporus biennis]